MSLAQNATAAHDTGVAAHVAVHQHGCVPHVTVVAENAVAAEVGVVETAQHAHTAGHHRGLDEQTDEDVAVEVAAPDLVQGGIKRHAGGAEQLHTAPVGRAVALCLQQEHLVGGEHGVGASKHGAHKVNVVADNLVAIFSLACGNIDSSSKPMTVQNT